MGRRKLPDADSRNIRLQTTVTPGEAKIVRQAARAAERTEARWLRETALVMAKAELKPDEGE